MDTQHMEETFSQDLGRHLSKKASGRGSSNQAKRASNPRSDRKKFNLDIMQPGLSRSIK
jgi:hypothetical protein